MTTPVPHGGHAGQTSAAVGSAPEQASPGQASPGQSSDGSAGSAGTGRPDAPTDPVAAPGGGEGDSSLTVLLALGANAGVGAAKLAAGLVTGSGALLSEAAHSVGDVTTELLLLVALKRSGKPADRRHPFGYGKERFFWSLLASVVIFASGAAFSLYQGVHTILGHEPEADKFWINYIVLGVALVLEGLSLRQALKQARADAREHQRSVRSQLRRTDDPTVTSIVLEDSAAVTGLLLAAAGVTLHHLTGQSLWDGLASISIGLLLIGVAGSLAVTVKDLLVGKQADPRLMQAIEQRLEGHDEILDVVDLLTMVTGADSVLVCARVDFVDGLDAADLERAVVRIDADLRETFSDLDEVFLEPVPRTDDALRQRVLARYGRAMADDPDDDPDDDPADEPADDPADDPAEPS